MANPLVNSRIVLPGSPAFKNLYSMLFDGVNEAININSTKTILAATTKGTWSFWVRPVDATPASTVVLICFGDTDSTSALEINIQTNGTCAAQSIPSPTGWVLITDAAAFTDNTWTHVMLVQDAVSPIIYINGVAVAQTFPVSIDKTIWFSARAGLDNGRIACRNFNSVGNSNFLNGNMDEIAFWNTNFSVAQVTETYNNGKPGNLKRHSAFSNLVMWVRGDGSLYDGTNFTFPNSSGNNSNTGTSINMELADLVNVVP